MKAQKRSSFFLKNTLAYSVGNFFEFDLNSDDSKHELKQEGDKDNVADSLHSYDHALKGKQKNCYCKFFTTVNYHCQ